MIVIGNACVSQDADITIRDKNSSYQPFHNRIYMNHKRLTNYMMIKEPAT